jgi:hypothetical protein
MSDSQVHPWCTGAASTSGDNRLTLDLTRRSVFASQHVATIGHCCSNFTPELCHHLVRGDDIGTIELKVQELTSTGGRIA